MAITTHSESQYKMTSAEAQVEPTVMAELPFHLLITALVTHTASNKGPHTQMPIDSSPSGDYEAGWGVSP